MATGDAFLRPAAKGGVSLAPRVSSSETLKLTVVIMSFFRYQSRITFLLSFQELSLKNGFGTVGHADQSEKSPRREETFSYAGRDGFWELPLVGERTSGGATRRSRGEETPESPRLTFLRETESARARRFRTHRAICTARWAAPPPPLGAV